MGIVFKTTFDNSKIDSTAFYDLAEHSFTSEPFFGDCSILIDKSYVSLDVLSDDGFVCGISGYSPEENWISRKLNFPKALDGRLNAIFDGYIQEGIAITHNRNWSTFFDLHSKVICIGNPIIAYNAETVEFCTNVVAVLADNELVSIWIKPKFI